MLAREPLVAGARRARCAFACLPATRALPWVLVPHAGERLSGPGAKNRETGQYTLFNQLEVLRVHVCRPGTVPRGLRRAAHTSHGRWRARDQPETREIVLGREVVVPEAALEDAALRALGAEVICTKPSGLAYMRDYLRGFFFQLWFHLSTISGARPVPIHSIPMSRLAPTAAIAAQVAQISGVPGAHILFGIANVIVEAANPNPAALQNVRVNKAAAVAFAKRVNEMASTVASILGGDTPGSPQNASALQVFHKALVDAQDALLAQGQRSYLAQLLSQQRDKDNLLDLSERVNNAFSTLMVELRIHASNAAVALSAQFETLLAQDSSHLQALPEVQETGLRIPARPQLHFGRTAETDVVVDALISRETAGRVAVLGGPGMGKTSLAVTVLHHPAVAARFGARRFFVPCDAAEDHETCLGTIAAAFGVVSSDAKTAQQKLREAIGTDPAVLTESAEALLQRWNELETAMLVRAQGLLSTLALLPNGVVDTDLRLWKLDQSAQAVAALLQTSLAVRGADQRIRVLAPIRSFMLANYPPSEGSVSTVYEHYFNLAELGRQSTLFKFDGEVFAAVAAELANIESLVRHALKSGHEARSAAIKAVSPLSMLYTQSGMGSAPELLPLAVNAAKEAQLENLRASLLLEWGRMAYSISVLGDPRTLVTEAREIYERIENADGAFDARIFLAEYLSTKDAIDEARQLYELAHAQDNKANVLRATFELGMALLRDGRPLEAIAQHESAIAILEKMPEPARPLRLVASNKYQLAELYRSVHRVPDAIKSYGEARDAFAAIQSAQGVAVMLTQLADTYLGLGRVHDAIDHATRALAAHQAAAFRNRRRCLLLIAQAHAMLGNADEAAGAMARVDEMSAAGGMSAFEECTVLRTRGALALWAGDYDPARALLLAVRARTRTRDIIEAPVYMLSLEASAMALLSDVEAAEEHDEEAANLAICAAVEFWKTGQSSEIPQCLTLLAEVVDDEFAELLVDVVALPSLRIGNARGLGMVLLRSAYVALRRGRNDVARGRATRAMQHFGDIIDGRRLGLARAILEDV
ncbi:hypothetical protein AURDEDRAFT_151324 [Auricularia subglabra TFB-10046 SS5]|nr:hypothetical protein AURDEDRAFT_151324 [Auricularia subglabra TFB-10046 SS5]